MTDVETINWHKDGTGAIEMIDLTAHAEAIRDAMHIRHWETAKEQDERILTAVRALAEDAAKAAIEAVASLVEADEGTQDQICCSGHMCGCQGSTLGQFLAHEVRALSPAYILEPKP